MIAGGVALAKLQFEQRESETAGIRGLPGERPPLSDGKKTVVIPGRPDIVPGDDDDDDGGGGPRPLPGVEGPAIQAGSCLSRHAWAYTRTPRSIAAATMLPDIGDWDVRLYMSDEAQVEFVALVRQLNQVSTSTATVQARRALDDLIEPGCFAGSPAGWPPAERALFSSAAFLAEGVLMTEGRPALVLEGDEEFVRREQLGMPSIGKLSLEPNQVVEMIAVDPEIRGSEEHIFVRVIAPFDEFNYVAEVIGGEFLGQDVTPRLGSLHGIEMGQQVFVADLGADSNVYRVYSQKVLPGSLPKGPAQNIYVSNPGFNDDLAEAVVGSAIAAGYSDRLLMVVHDSSSPGDANAVEQIVALAAQYPEAFFMLLDCRDMVGSEAVPCTQTITVEVFNIQGGGISHVHTRVEQSLNGALASINYYAG
jgi:hypothetical protein